MSPGSCYDIVQGLVVIFTFLVLHPTTCRVIAAEIVHPPRDIIVVVGDWAEFTCEVQDASFTSWRVNSTYTSSLPTSIRGDIMFGQTIDGDYEVHSLSMRTRAEYNQTKFQCVVISAEDEIFWSENATLLIQGLLTKVNSIVIGSDCDSINISWSAPFSLDVSGEDPDIWYTVLISNVTDEDHPTAVPCTDCHNLTQTHYTFSPDPPSPCHKYTFTVTPCNGAGQGESSQPVTGVLNSAHVSIGSEETKVYTRLKKQTDDYSILMYFPTLPGTVVCQGPPETHNIYFESGLQSCPTFVISLLGKLHSNDSVLTFDAPLTHNCTYNLTVEMTNCLGRTNSTGLITLYGPGFNSTCTDFCGSFANENNDLTFLKGLGFGTAIGAVSTLLISLAVILIIGGVKAMRGHKEKVSVKKNLAYEVPTLCRAEGGAKLPAEMNIVYEEIY